MARAKSPANYEDARVQIFTKTMSDSLLQALQSLYGSIRLEKKEHALCVFAFLAETVTTVQDYIKGPEMQCIDRVVTQLISEVARPSFYSEDV